jgi:hypothetical protein
MKIRQMRLAAKRFADQNGSAMLASVFVLLILSVTGVGLLFMTSNELKMSRKSVALKEAFYLAEAGIEDARTRLHVLNGTGNFTDDLVRAEGDNNAVDLDAANLAAVFDDAGNVVGLTGHGDDLPLVPLTRLGRGWYTAFLTNDPVETITNTTDGNDQVMITGVGISENGAFEVAQAIISLEHIFPSLPQATITLLGPQPNFQGADSEPKMYDGNDCGGLTIPYLQVPVVGVVGGDAESSAEQGIRPNPTYRSGTNSDEDTFADLTDGLEPTVISAGMGTLPDAWAECSELKRMIEGVRSIADVQCVDSDCVLPPPRPGRVVFVDGDYVVAANQDGQGLLVVTGELKFHGRATWRGLVYVIGEGRFRRFGSGGGIISGATVVADIAGPDEVYGTADDCTGGDDGLGTVFYDERGGGVSDTVYCTADMAGVDPAYPYEVEMFRQR